MSRSAVVSRADKSPFLQGRCKPRLRLALRRLRACLWELGTTLTLRNRDKTFGWLAGWPAVMNA